MKPDPADEAAQDAVEGRKYAIVGDKRFALVSFAEFARRALVPGDRPVPPDEGDNDPHSLTWSA